MNKHSATCAVLVSASLILAATVPAPASVFNVRINEIRLEQPGLDRDEYFELCGTSGTQLTGLTYVVIGPSDIGGSGVIHLAVDLSGHSIPSDGYFLVAKDLDPNPPLPSFPGASVNMVAPLYFENDANLTHLLVWGFTGYEGQDLDTNDDGILDIVPWHPTVDSLAVVIDPNPVAPEHYYSDTVVGPDGGFAPAHVYRYGNCQPGSFWQIGTYSISSLDTPGVANPGPSPPPEPVITAWRSVRSHGGAGELPIALDPAASGNGTGGPSVEPRHGGIQRIEVDFDQAVTLIDPAAVSVIGHTTVGGLPQDPVSYTPSVSLADSDTRAIITFAAGILPDQTCYTIDLAGSVQGLTGDTDCRVRSLVGDASGDGLVDSSDVLYVKSQVTSPPQGFDPASDINHNGVINLGDVLFISRLATGAPEVVCPP